MVEKVIFLPFFSHLLLSSFISVQLWCVSCATEIKAHSVYTTYTLDIKLWKTFFFKKGGKGEAYSNLSQKYWLKRLATPYTHARHFLIAVRPGRRCEPSCPYTIFVWINSWVELRLRKKKVASMTFSTGMAVWLCEQRAVVWSVYFHLRAMDFNVKRLAADAGTFLSRAVQVSLTVPFVEVVANHR